MARVERKILTTGSSKPEPHSSIRQLFAHALIEIRDERWAPDNDRGVSFKRGTTMLLRTISFALLANSDPEPTAAARYALDLAGCARACLFVRRCHVRGFYL
jgi:hypothetical protein